jgi:hypothetical protein
MESGMPGVETAVLISKTPLAAGYSMNLRESFFS